MAGEQSGFTPEEYASQPEQTGTETDLEFSIQESLITGKSPAPENSLIINQKKELDKNTSEQTIFERSRTEEDTGRKERKSVFATALGLIGAESIAKRHSDKRLQREIENLQKRVKQGENAARDLQSLAPNMSEQLSSIAAKQEEFTASEISPSQVLETVIEAAEHDEPIELDYERRQEIKDETGQPSSKTGATPVGEVIAGMTNGIDIAQNTTIPIDNRNKESIKSLSSSLTYRQAARLGFRSAAVIIVLVIFLLFIKTI